jgi:hypothetical protein
LTSTTWRPTVKGLSLIENFEKLTNPHYVLEKNKFLNQKNTHPEILMFLSEIAILRISFRSPWFTT